MIVLNTLCCAIRNFQEKGDGTMITQELKRLQDSGHLSWSLAYVKALQTFSPIFTLQITEIPLLD
jgi:hypothetical protein